MKMLTRSLKFVIVETDLCSGRGNTNRELAKDLKKEGFNVYTISKPIKHNEKRRELRNLGVKIYSVIKGNALNIPYTILLTAVLLLKLRLLNFREKIIVYSPKTAVMPFMYPLLKLLAVKFVYSTRPLKLDATVKYLGDYYLIHGERLGKPKLFLRLKFTVIALVQMLNCLIADAVVVNKHLTKKILAKSGVNPHKIFVIPHWFRKEQVGYNPKKRRELRKKYGIKNDEVLITYLGRLSNKVLCKKMVVDDLITLLDQVPDKAKFLVAGGGDALPYYRHKIKTLGKESKLIICGNVPYDEIPALLSASDVFYFIIPYEIPSTGLALLEAMACGNAVITNDSPACRELIKPDEGMLVPYDLNLVKNKLNLLIKNKKIRQRYSKNARISVHKTSEWAVAFEKYVGVLRYVYKTME